MQRFCVLKKEYIEEVLQLIEDGYPDIIWASGHKPTEWILGKTTSWTVPENYFIAFQIYYDDYMTFSIHETLDDCFYYINGCKECEIGYIFDSLVYEPTQDICLDDIGEIGILI